MSKSPRFGPSNLTHVGTCEVCNRQVLLYSNFSMCMTCRILVPDSMDDFWTSTFSLPSFWRE